MDPPLTGSTRSVQGVDLSWTRDVGEFEGLPGRPRTERVCNPQSKLGETTAWRLDGREGRVVGGTEDTTCPERTSSLQDP